MVKNAKVISVVGARPNFVKIAPLVREFVKHKNIKHILVHTGQHYTDSMSDIFFKDFRIERYVNFNIGGDSPIRQMAKIMIMFERFLLRERPDLVIVVGDVNSTLVCALTAVKLNIKVAHVEAGLRSFDRAMPEEINRILTDSISDYLFVTEPSGLRNLQREGVAKERIHFVGNIMIDSLIYSIAKARRSDICERLSLKKREYAILTLHRPSNVDDSRQLEDIIGMLSRMRKKAMIVYPVHPRSVKMLKKFGYWNRLITEPNIIVTEPLGYLDFLKLMMNAKFVITDSGGIQEETTYLGMPCFTLRKNTERPITVSRGTNRIIGDDYNLLSRLIDRVSLSRKKDRPELWDGRTAARIVRILKKDLFSDRHVR